MLPYIEIQVLDRHTFTVLLLLWLTKHHVGGQGQKDIRCVIQEELEIDSLVTDLKRDSSLSDRFAGSAHTDTRFRFLSKPPCDIELDESSGKVMTRGRIDREAICKEEGVCSFRLDVAITWPGSFEIVRLTVEVDDLNDNEPVFHPSAIRQEMGEGSALGSAVVLPPAKDRDSSPYSIAGYSKSDDEQHFELRYLKKQDGSTDVRLILVKHLDRETKDRHRIQVVAFDGGTPSLSGTLLVEIIVTDANDNPPVFDYESYEVNIVENIPLGTVVAQVRATDLDLDKNGKVVHSFSPQTFSDYGSVFLIDPSTGEIQVVGVVDYESNQVFRLTVNAKDEGQNILTAETTIMIQVEDANDNPPLIIINTLDAFNTDVSTVSEGVEPGSFVAQVRVTDSDSGLNGQFNCSLDREVEFTLQSTADGDYMIVTTVTLDRERRDQYSMTMRCMDGGRTALSSSRQLDVRVLDANDHDPRFLKNQYEEGVLENNYIGAVVVQVSATDRDEGDNARIIYELPVDAERYFEIDSNDGTIRAKISLDREKVDVHRFFVYATDDGLPVRTGSALVVLRVIDVNDESPMFRFDSSDSLTVTENLPSGTEVGVLSATDADDYPLNTFTFSFLPGGSLSDAFSVDSRTGRITTTRTLDREEREIYHLIAVVRDSNSPTLSSTATVPIIVADENDNDPTFTDPFWIDSTGKMSSENRRNNITIIIVPRESIVGTTIAEVKATDPDSGLNGTITYSVSDDQSCPNAFEIDSFSGRMTLTVSLFDCRENVTLELNVTASDLGNPSRQSSTRLRVLVETTSVDLTAPGQAKPLVGLTFNFILVLILSLAVGSGMIISMIIVVIVVRSRSRRQSDSQKYNCRKETIKAMNLNQTNYGNPSKVKDNHSFPVHPGSGGEQRSVEGPRDSTSNPSRYSALPSVVDGRWNDQSGREGVTMRNDSVAVLLRSDSPSSFSKQVVATRIYETVPSTNQNRSLSSLRSRDNTSSPVLNRKLANRPQPNSLTSLASDFESKSQWREEEEDDDDDPAPPLPPPPPSTVSNQSQNGVRPDVNGSTLKLPPQIRMGDIPDGRNHHPDNDHPPNYHLDEARIQLLLSNQKTRSPFSHGRSDTFAVECSSFRPERGNEEDVYSSFRERFISNNVH